MIKDLLTATGLKKGELARELGVSPVTMSNWLSGRTEPTGATQALIKMMLQETLEQKAKKIEEQIKGLRK